MAITVLAALTDKGRAAFADASVTGSAFVVSSFEVGSGGHDVGNPIVALTPDTSLTSLSAVTFGPEDIDEAGLPTDLFTPEFLCVLQQNEAVGELSNIGLYAKYTAIGENTSIATNPDTGEVTEAPWLFAVGNFPLRVKVDSESVEFRISVIF